jgi:hypothetical protein
MPNAKEELAKLAMRDVEEGTAESTDTCCPFHDRFGMLLTVLTDLLEALLADLEKKRRMQDHSSSISCVLATFKHCDFTTHKPEQSGSEAADGDNSNCPDTTGGARDAQS